VLLTTIACAFCWDGVEQALTIPAVNSSGVICGETQVPDTLRFRGLKSGMTRMWLSR
jgi:hypothetical protein